jgi:branched-chain amino acid transport system substrate-binding protein
MTLRTFGAMLVAVMLAAVACTSGPAGTAQPSTAVQSQPASGAPGSVAPSVAATDGAGEGRVVTIGPDDPIHIAMWGVLSGSDAPLGQDVLNGVEIAVADKGTLLDHEIQLTSEDAGCTPEGGNTAATRLASDVTLVGLIGSVCSDETAGGIAQVTAAGLTTISPSNTRPALTAEDRGPEYDGYLRTAHNDLVQGAAAAEFVYNVLGLRSAATIHDNSSYAQALQQVFADEFTGLGGTITIQTAVGGEDTDMTPVLTNVAATDPEIIYYPVFTAPFGFITAQVRNVPGLEDVELMGADAGFSASAIEAGGENALGLYLSSPDTRQYEAGYQEFLGKYQEAEGQLPIQIFHAQAYDATNMLFAAIEEVAEQGADGSLTIDLLELRERIYATENFPGLTGTLTCTEFGDCADPAIGVYEITQEIVDDPEANWPPDAIWPDLGGTPGESPAAESPEAE